MVFKHGFQTPVNVNLKPRCLNLKPMTEIYKLMFVLLIVPMAYILCTNIGLKVKSSFSTGPIMKPMIGLSKTYGRKP